MNNRKELGEQFLNKKYDDMDKKVRRFKTLQASVFQRMMDPKEFEELMKKYQESSGASGKDKTVLFNERVSNSEKQILYRYLFTDASASRLGKEVGRKNNTMRNYLAGLAFKIFHQNKEHIDIEAIFGVKGGEEQKDE